MTTDFTDLTALALLWLTAYLVHSTLLLGLAWLTTRIIGRRSFALQDQIWKLAMLLPLLTATIQQAGGPSSLAIARWTIAAENRPDAADSEPVEEPPRGATAQTATGVSQSETSFEVPSTAIADPAMTAPAATTNDRPSDPTPGVPPTESDWTIAIQPGPATEALPPPDEIADVAPTAQFATEADEEMRSRGDEGMNLTQEPRPSVLSSSPHHPLSSSRHLSLLTIAGALISLHLIHAALRLLTLAWKERRRLAGTAPIDDGPARLALDRILASRRIRRPVQILSARHIRGPAACGWRQWRIVLPAGLDCETPQDELRALLAHELSHLVRRDTIWLWGSHALCILLPVQPLNFIARRRWEEAAEYLCDAWAVEADVHPLTMAKCLTRVADRYVGNAAPMGLTAVGSRTTLSRRIERLTAGKIGRRQGRASRAVVVLLAGVLAAGTVIAAPQVSLRGERASIAEREREHESVVPGDSVVSGDEGMRGSGDEELDSIRADSRDELRRELESLLTDLERVNELLSAVDDSPELAAAREQMQRRLQRIRDRGFGAIDERDPDARSVRSTAEPVSNE
jgi:beta-lactamase regulating signal transducer with metallopeptidase domain